MSTSDRPRISVIIPVFNEIGSLPQLHAEVSRELDSVASWSEILYIDDGSSDGSAEHLHELAATDPRVRVFAFRANRGKADALNVGFRAALGDVIITMDADLQDVPSEMPKLLAGLQSADLVSGWKQTRNDPLGKTLPSKFFNWTTRKLSGVNLRDFNCGYKAYRAEVVRELDLYGEMHRFIPVLAGWNGFRVAEVAVEHSPRRWGKSKYGLSRLLKGAYDLVTVLLLTRFQLRPMHVFGSAGFLLASTGFVVLTYMSFLRLVRQETIGNRPLLFLGIVLLLAGVQLVSAGLLGELIVRRTRARSEVPPLRFLTDRSEPKA